jgi:prepilin-type processing-associated H-X9-DG protein
MQSLRTRPISAFTLIELLVTIACVLVVVLILMPTLARSRARSSRIGCTNNLKQIGLAFRTWALDNNSHYPMQESITSGGTMELVASGFVFPHFRVMSNELSTPKILVCPNDSSRTYATNFERDLKDAKLSYFINVDSVGENRSSLLCGDRNLNIKALAGSRFVRVSSTTVVGWDRQMHREKGNVCFADGSVDGFFNGAIGPAQRLPAGVTNRLAIP